MFGDVTRAGLPGWHLHPDVWLLLALLEGAYLLALRRHAARTGEGAARPAQIVLFSAGVATLWLASDWPVHDLGEGYLYSFHMVQHLLLTLVATPLLLLGTPPWLARRLLSPQWLMKLVRGISRPVPNLAQANVILILSHWPLVVDATLRHHPLHFVAHAVLIGSAILLWLPVASPLREVPRIAPPAQMLYLFLQTIIPTVPASFLTFGKKALYPIYESFPRLWGISAVGDQQVAGLIMKIGAGAYLWTVIIVIFFRWYAREEAKPDDVLLWNDVERELRRLERPEGAR
ncbi:MAG: cytochrome c oxidase assembly protein [Actinobacteria bacterium]|nr:cytochrome c oxidase assembly protein [Actinomycetota bacterium]